VNLGVDDGFILATTVTHGAALIHDRRPWLKASLTLSPVDSLHLFATLYTLPLRNQQSN
jgi:hypothetical protein